MIRIFLASIFLMIVRIYIGMPPWKFPTDTVVDDQMHVHRLQLGQGINSGQFDQLDMCEAKAGVLCKNVLLVKRAGLLANNPERVARYLICLVRHSLNLD